MHRFRCYAVTARVTAMPHRHRRRRRRNDGGQQQHVVSSTDDHGQRRDRNQVLRALDRPRPASPSRSARRPNAGRQTKPPAGEANVNKVKAGETRWTVMQRSRRGTRSGTSMPPNGLILPGVRMLIPDEFRHSEQVARSSLAMDARRDTRRPIRTRRSRRC